MISTRIFSRSNRQSTRKMIVSTIDWSIREICFYTDSSIVQHNMNSIDNDGKFLVYLVFFKNLSLLDFSYLCMISLAMFYDHCLPCFSFVDSDNDQYRWLLKLADHVIIRPKKKQLKYDLFHLLILDIFVCFLISVHWCMTKYHSILDRQTNQTIVVIIYRYTWPSTILASRFLQVVVHSEDTLAVIHKVHSSHAHREFVLLFYHSYSFLIARIFSTWRYHWTSSTISGWSWFRWITLQ
jgi:hypothetical protein